jgi:hypothetical protein
MANGYEKLSAATKYHPQLQNLLGSIPNETLRY